MLLRKVSIVVQWGEASIEVLGFRFEAPLQNRRTDGTPCIVGTRIICRKKSAANDVQKNLNSTTPIRGIFHQRAFCSRRLETTQCAYKNVDLYSFRRDLNLRQFRTFEVKLKLFENRLEQQNFSHRRDELKMLQTYLCSFSLLTFNTEEAAKS